MSETRIADRADEAAHEAVLEVIKASPFHSTSLAGPDRGELIAKNLIDLHKELAAYYRTLESDF